MPAAQICSSSYRNQPRRRFTQAYKAQVVEQLLSDQSLTVAQVAREHDVHPNQLCRWRREYHAANLPALTEPVRGRSDMCAGVELVPVGIITEPRARAPERPTVASGPMASDAVVLRITVAGGTIEITNACDPVRLEAVLQVLR
jgi:transposase